MKPAPDSRITVRLTNKLNEDITKLANQDSRKKSDYVRKVLIDHVRNRGVQAAKA